MPRSALQRAPALLACAATVLALGACTPQRAAHGPVVRAPAGAVQGRAEGALNVFRGVPYAAPPLGAARWTPPRPAAPWPGVRAATAFGPACVQPARRLSSIYAADIGATSEDCLSLNIWAPAHAHAAPVLVWIHGGALQSGASSEPLYDGARLAERGIIVVSINYRLGVLGFLAHPELSAESPRGVSGNYGLLDQIEALRWVKRNITAFGGDPDNVTIAGESAGALSVVYLMTAPDARGLFAKAIVQSAHSMMLPELKQARFGVASAEETGLARAAAMGAADLAALRAMDAQALADAPQAATHTLWLTVDGQVLPRQLLDAFDAGAQARVPLLVGFTSGELRSLRALAPRPAADAAAYGDAIRARYADLADEFLRLYPSDGIEESILAATRDGLHGWTSERLARKQTERGAPAFLYLFDHGYPAADAAGLHAFHGSELPFLFGAFAATPPNWPPVPDEPAQRRLADAMIGYWTSFARTGAPAAAGAPPWPAYGDARAYMRFADAPRAAERLFPGVYEHVEEVVCRRRRGGQAWTGNYGLAAPPLPAPIAACSPPR